MLTGIVVVYITAANRPGMCHSDVEKAKRTAILVEIMESVLAIVGWRCLALPNGAPVDEKRGRMTYSVIETKKRNHVDMLVVL